MRLIECPVCGETNDLEGRRHEATIVITCGACGQSWERSLRPTCRVCGGHDLQEVPVAIVEKPRGTQLSVVGIRVVTCAGTAMPSRSAAGRPIAPTR